MSFYFNGSGYSLASDYSAIDFSSSNFTLFAWVNPDRVNSGDAVFCKWNNDNTGLQTIRWRVGPTGYNEITIRGSSTYGPIQSSGTFSTGVWQPCGGIRRGTGTNQVESWLNGAYGTGTASSGPNNTSQVWQIAQEGTGNNIQGYIAELAVWNVAISVDEMLALHSGVTPPFIRRASLVYYVPFIMNAAALDLSGNKLTTSGGSGTWTENWHPPVGRMMPQPY